MEIAIIENEKITVDHYRKLFPNVSFPESGPSKEFMEENNCLGVMVFKPHDRSTQKLVACDPYIEDNQVFTVRVENLEQEELDAIYNAKAFEVRTERNKRLSETDWRFRSDMNPSQEWTDYCQALRDITTQNEFPFKVEWPKAPSSDD